MSRTDSEHSDGHDGEPLMSALTEPMQPAPQPARMGLGLRLLSWMLQGLRVGSLEVSFPNGSVRRYVGSEAGPHGVLNIRKATLVRHVLRNGEVGFGEAYMDGCWDTPNLTALLQVLYLNEPHYRGPYERNVLGRFLGWLQHRRRLSRARARDNIAHHYDLGNDFYKLWLDPTLTYSSAVFTQPNQSLEDAQIEKYRRLAERLDLRPEHHLLEIGSGWGGFALYCARRYGCRVTSITLSTEQLAEAQARAVAQGLSERVHFRLQDYRDHDGRYDRIASIEMYEAVGEQHWPDYFAAIQRMLVPGGVAALQGITISPEIFDEYRRKRDFIQKYIFPGGMLCPPEHFQRLAGEAGLQPEDAQFFGPDYARTLAIWHRNVLAQRERILASFDVRFLRMWRYYLSYCECGFNTASIDLMQISLRKPA